jgi:hypothetical protein
MIAAIADTAALIAAIAASLFAALAAIYARQARNAYLDIRQPKGRAQRHERGSRT